MIQGQNSSLNMDELLNLAEPLAIASEAERRVQRLNMSYEVISNMYDVLQPCLLDASRYLDECANTGPLGEREQKLSNLLKFYMELAITVEFLGEPNPKDLFPGERFLIADVLLEPSVKSG
jgi:hypothetical protein